MKELETGTGGCEYTCTDLQPGTAYFFGVCAQNAAGWGLWVMLNAYGLTKSAPPARPERLRVIAATVNSVRLGWIRPATNGSAVVLYEIVYDDGTGRTCACIKEPVAKRLTAPTPVRAVGGAAAAAAAAKAAAVEAAVAAADEEEEQEVGDVAPGTCLLHIQVQSACCTYRY